MIAFLFLPAPFSDYITTLKTPKVPVYPSKVNLVKTLNAIAKTIDSTAKDGWVSYGSVALPINRLFTSLR